MKTIVLNTLLLFIFSSVLAHNGVIRGEVLDAQTNLPFRFTKVSLMELNINVNTNSFGKFLIPNLDAGTYTLEINEHNRARKEISVTVNEEDTTDVYINLDPVTTVLREIRIQTDQIANANNISKMDIKLRPLNSAQDVLRSVPGLFIAQHAGGGKAEQIFLRGFDCDHGTDINLSVDGMPVNMVSHAHGQGYADLHFLLPETIERVQVQKGSYNSSIGNLATAGSVQFQTKNKVDENLVSIEGGNFSTFRLFGMMNILPQRLQEKDQHAFIAGEYYYRRGYFERPDNLLRTNLFAKYYGLVRKHHHVTFQASTFASNWNASGQIPDRAVQRGMISRFGSIDPTEGGATDRTNASLKVETDLHQGKFLRNQIFVTKYNFNLNSNFTFYKNDSINGDKINQHENRTILGYNGAYFSNRKIKNLVFNTEIGMQVRYDIIKNISLNQTTASNELLNRLSWGNVHEMNTAIYLNETIDLSSKLKLNLGVREDFFLFNYADNLNASTKSKVTKAITSPKFSLYYSYAKNLQFYISSGKGFHSNDTRVAVAQNGLQILPSAYGAELGTNYKPTQHILLTMSAWYLKLNQEFVYVGDEAIVEASGKTKRVGIDIGLRYSLTSWLFADMDYNYSIPRALQTSKDENRIPLAPISTSIGGLTIKTKSGLNISVRYRYLADRPANESNTLIASGYFINDAVIDYTFRKMQVGLSVENIFNKKWKEAQFETESKLKNESNSVTEIHYTSGTPLFMKAKVAIRF